MEDDLFFFVNGRRPHIFNNWKTTSHFLLMEDDLKFVCKWKTTSIVLQMEDDLNLFIHGRLPICCKWKTTSIVLQMEDDLNVLVN